jgi:glutamate-ammonia-ligase adenylyltransferase
MRLLIDKKHQSDVIWDTKYIRGGLIDIEFIVQYLQLKNAHDNPNILATNTSDALKRLAKEKILTNMQIGKLNDALKLWQTIQGILRLTVQGFFRPKPEQEVPKALAQVMIDATGCSDIRELESRIIVSAKDVYEIYKNLIGNPIKTSSNEAS